jgi:hypothetical protein
LLEADPGFREKFIDESNNKLALDEEFETRFDYYY